MAKGKVKVQMRMNKVCKSSRRYGAWGSAANEICRMMYVENQAFEELGKPNVITVVIEADVLSGGT